MVANRIRWTAGKVCSEGQPIDIGGINPWEFEWITLDKPVLELPHPSHANQIHKFWRYRVTAYGQEIVFAAGELSANVWGFYEEAD